jgi:O-antigen ligase
VTVAAGRLGPAALPRATAADGLAVAGSVLLVLVYSQAWVAPLMGEGPAATETSALIRGLFYPAYAAALALAALNVRAVVEAFVRAPLLLLLLLLAVASTVWSIDPDVTVRRVVALGLTTLSGVVIATRFSWRGLAEVMGLGFAVLVVLSFGAGLLAPSVGVMSELFPGAWRGLWSEKNMLGAHMALASAVFMAAAVLRPERRAVWLGFFAAAVLLVLLSTSKTALLAMLLGFAVLGFVALVRRSAATGVATTWAAGVGVAVLALGALFAAEAVFDLLGKDATLTGRTQIWEAAVRQVSQQPWTGFGYGAVWDNASRWGPLAAIAHEIEHLPQHAHNGWLEVWLGLGLVGVVIWAAYLLEVWARALGATYGERNPGAAYLALPTLAIFTLMTLTESVVGNYNDLRWVFFVAVAVKLASPGWRA